jgi:hypothetical protein
MPKGTIASAKEKKLECYMDQLLSWNQHQQWSVFCVDWSFRQLPVELRRILKISAQHNDIRLISQ